MRNARPPRDSDETQAAYFAYVGREPDPGTVRDTRHGMRWLVAGVCAFFMGVVIGELWPQVTAGVRNGVPRNAAVTAAPAAQPQRVPTEIVEVGTHRLAVPARLIGSGEADASRRSRGGLVTYLAWSDPENPNSEASRRCVEARPRCRDTITVIVTGNRQPVAQQWANAQRTMQPVAGGEAYGVRLFAPRPGPDGRASATVEFGEASASGGTVHGRCARARRDPQPGATAPGGRETATIDPSATCTLAFDLRPGLSVTVLVRGERIAEWRRAQLAAASAVEGFVAAGAASRA
jgi:hypothetical protein